MATLAAMAGQRPAATFGRRINALLLTVVLIVVTLGIGWLVWSVVEWRHGRTASYRKMGLRVVSRSDAKPIGLSRSILRNAILCTLLIIPTVLVCVVLGIVFSMGASPPEGLLNTPRPAPWDRLTGTLVVDERAPARREPMGTINPVSNGKAHLAGHDLKG
jgi:hypothetical protein